MLNVIDPPRGQRRGRGSRRHGTQRIAHADRRALERAGWRTLLDYRENHVRGDDGTLVGIVPQWTAEAERAHDRDGHPTTVVATVTAASRDEAWRLLRRAVFASDLG